MRGLDPRIFRLIIDVPDIVGDLPVLALLLPDHDIFSDDLLRAVALGLQRELADLPRMALAHGLDLDGSQLGVAHGIGGGSPVTLNGFAALHHLGTWRKDARIVCIEPGNGGKVAGIECRGKPLVISLDGAEILRERCSRRSKQQGGTIHQLAHDGGSLAEPPGRLRLYATGLTFGTAYSPSDSPSHQSSSC